MSYNPSESLARCKEIIPELNLDMKNLSDNFISVAKVDFKKWGKIFKHCLALCAILKLKLNDFPDVEPYTEFMDIQQDLGALLHSLYIFYECTSQDGSDT